MSASDNGLGIGNDFLLFHNISIDETIAGEADLKIRVGELLAGSFYTVKRTSIDRASVDDIKRSEKVFNQGLLDFLADPINLLSLAELMGAEEVNALDTIALNDTSDFLVEVKETGLLQQDAHHETPLTVYGAVSAPEDMIAFTDQNTLEDGVLAALIPFGNWNLALVSVDLGLRQTILVTQRIGAVSLLEQARAAGLSIPLSTSAEEVSTLIGGPSLQSLASEFDYVGSDKPSFQIRFENEVFMVDRRLAILE
ncbi:MAG: hypothetical protein AAGF53_02465 [Pseudomonadota bacterium]